MKKKNKKQKSEFDFCKVCNRNHDEGQRHKYFPSHTNSLSKFFSRFQNKLTEVRFFLKNPSFLRLELASRNRLWCIFCDCDIDELGSSFACQNAINHLASGDHLKNLKHFLWKYGGGMDRVDAFRISQADIAKWETKCKSLKSEAAPCGGTSQGFPSGLSNDIHKELDYENLNNYEKNTLHHLNSNISNVVMPLQQHTNEYQVSRLEHSGVANVGSNMHVITSTLSVDPCDGTSLWNANNLMDSYSSLMVSVVFLYLLAYGNGAVNDSNCSGDVSHNKKGKCKMTCLSHCFILMIVFWNLYMDNTLSLGSVIPICVAIVATAGLQNITQISSFLLREAGGNVHSGAPPPWFEETQGDQLNVQLNQVSTLNKSGKLKLNPKRVGAAWAEKRKMEMEMEKRGGIVKSDCDPNWLPNFGRVWQSGSRKESRKEFEFEKQKQPNVHSLSEMPMEIKPYVSKRMRRDEGEHSGDPHLN
ncbi:TITAN-like protein [Citrus sinensis]|uniref:TITAN-like protein n=1 Tax=Citrus sinensis TaxID=2711 RepID=A0ACB8L900_CITSI|nr:TITAN-like protein [Citrus sinensis]